MFNFLLILILIFDSLIYIWTSRMKRDTGAILIWNLDKHIILLIKCLSRKNYFCQFILLVNLFLLLFMSFTAFFDTIHESYYTISTNFYFYEFYLQYLQQKIFNFNQINRSQTGPKWAWVLNSILDMLIIIYAPLSNKFNATFFS